NQKQTQRFFFNSYFQNLAKELYNRAYTKGKATLLLATQKNKIITGTLLLHYKNSWINFYGLSKNEQENEQAAVEILLWNAILLAKQNGATRFDFEGSMIEGVERIFRRFGAKPVPYLNITKNALPIFLRWLKKSGTV
ncbi:MAG: GNAT family N-acetyltransferase, partial [Bacteroidia bacterium]|nr:GNAT family N-acetyltransferase [Bacteroidia bacterium]